ncbi:MAG: hypothetical protein HYX62_00685 [Gammaproteobacteria bacterium]|nr:hypothetical protein [Gammaproteobacteria bacterium]
MENTAIRLQTPCPDKSLGMAFDPHPVKVKEWIEHLPRFNTGETAHALYCALTTLNRVILPVQHRCQILELFRTPTRQVITALRKQYIGAAFPLSDSCLKDAHLARDLQNEMANGYKVSLNNLITHQSSAFTAGKALLLLHHAMQYLIDALLTSYQIYTPCPGIVWRDIHQLYRYTEQKHLHESAIHNTEGAAIPHHSIGDLYKQALLLALANPYHLSQNEINTVVGMLGECASLSSLGHVSGVANLTESFLIDLEKDEPTSSPATQKNCFSKSCRVLDTSSLINHLRNTLSQQEAQTSQKSPLPHDLLLRLMSSWGTIPQRNFSRINKNSVLVVTVGLSAIHNAINAAPTSPNETRKGKASFTSRPVAGLYGEEESWDEQKVEKDQQDIWNIFNQTTYFAKQQETQPAPLPAATLPFATYECAVVNESANGACLAWEGNKKTAKFKIGELIGTRITNQGNLQEWGVAVIRWMKNVKNSRMEFGIQMIAPIAEPVTLSRCGMGKGTIDQTAGLLLPEIKAINQPATLIVPAHIFSAGNKVAIKTHSGKGGNMQTAQLTEPLQNTGLFVQFRFTPEHDINDDTLASGAQMGDKEFELM